MCAYLASLNISSISMLAGILAIAWAVWAWRKQRQSDGPAEPMTPVAETPDPEPSEWYRTASAELEVEREQERQEAERQAEEVKRAAKGREKPADTYAPQVQQPIANRDKEMMIQASNLAAELFGGKKR